MYFKATKLSFFYDIDCSYLFKANIKSNDIFDFNELELSINMNKTRINANFVNEQFVFVELTNNSFEQVFGFEMIVGNLRFHRILTGLNNLSISIDSFVDIISFLNRKKALIDENQSKSIIRRGT